MILETLQKLFERDLLALKEEILRYTNEEHLWLVDKGISNSGGNLCLHLIGNLKHFIGNHIGGFNYERNRDFEFKGKDVSRELMVREIENTVDIVLQSLSKLDDATLVLDYPIVVFKEKMTYEFFLIHLTTHLKYHLGQINYHRRLLDN